MSAEKTEAINWMNLPEEYRGDNSAFLIIPLPFEHNPTFGAGANKGPEAIIEASEHLEYYDEQFDCEPFEKGIRVLKTPELPADPEKMAATVSEESKKYLGKFVIGLGGDHAVTIGLAQDLPDDVNVLILDAHPDMKFSWNGSQYNHACVARRLCTKRKVGIVGVRSMDVDEAKDIEKNENVRIIKAYENSEDALDELLDFLGDKVYISLDVDVFDPAFLRSTGTPEPGGFSWDQVIAILARVFEHSAVVGADIVEFSPEGPSSRAEAFSLAKLAYKLMALAMKRADIK
ncbi:agmatinase [Candidatus Woesearchaeota archaeon]|nr:agmatinase [Candidatus Woesearchaeota archaeon]